MAQDRETPASNATNFTLLCSANAYGQRLNKILVVDLSKKTVNSAKAAVTENMITWSTTDYSDITKGNRINRHELNRLAGSYQSWTVGATYPGPPPDFSCSCRIPDDCIDPKRYPLFMGRAVMQELIIRLKSKANLQTEKLN